MAKLRRFPLENRCYHVVTTTRDRVPLFSDAADARILLKALQFVRRERAYLLAYVIMPDHLHVVIAPRPPYTVSQIMQTVKGYTSRAINAKNGDRGPLWQRSFYDRMIRDEEQLGVTTRYIHGNPVTAGLVQEAEHYPFSSARPGAETDLEEFLSG